MADFQKRVIFYSPGCLSQRLESLEDSQLFCRAFPGNILPQNIDGYGYSCVRASEFLLGLEASCSRVGSGMGLFGHHVNPSGFRFQASGVGLCYTCASENHFDGLPQRQPTGISTCVSFNDCDKQVQSVVIYTHTARRETKTFFFF